MKNTKGFSLIEVLAVVAIIAILAAIAIPIYSRYKCKGEWAEVQGCLADVAMKLDNYRSNHGVYPPSNDWTTILPNPNVVPCQDTHYAGSFETTATAYKVVFSDTRRPLACSPNPGDDRWVMVSFSPKVYHSGNPIGKEDPEPTLP